MKDPGAPPEGGAALVGGGAEYTGAAGGGSYTARKVGSAGLGGGKGAPESKVLNSEVNPPEEECGGAGGGTGAANGSGARYATGGGTGVATGWNGGAGAPVCSAPPIVFSSDVNPPLELAGGAGAAGDGAGENTGAANADVEGPDDAGGEAGFAGTVLKSSVFSSCVNPPLDAGAAGATGAAIGAGGTGAPADCCPSTCRSRSSSRSISPVVNFSE